MTAELASEACRPGMPYITAAALLQQTLRTIGAREDAARAHVEAKHREDQDAVVAAATTHFTRLGGDLPQTSMVSAAAWFGYVAYDWDSDWSSRPYLAVAGLGNNAWLIHESNTCSSDCFDLSLLRRCACGGYMEVHIGDDIDRLADALHDIVTTAPCNGACNYLDDPSGGIAPR